MGLREPVQHGQHVQQGRALAPQPGLGDLDAVPLQQRRRLPGRAVRRQVGAAHQPGPQPPVGAGELPVGEGLDRVRHEAGGPLLARRLRLGRDVVAGGGGGRDQALQHRGVRRVGEQLARDRHRAPRQPDLGRGRPLLGEQVADALDGGGDAGQERVPVAGVVDGRPEHGGQRQRAVVAQQQQPGVDGAGHGRGERPRAGHVVQPHRRERLGGGGRGGGTLAAQHPRTRVGGGGDDRGQVAAGAVEVGLDDVQHEAARHRGVEGVAAELEHPHRGLRGQPVRGGDHAEAAGQGGTGGEGGHRAEPREPGLVIGPPVGQASPTHRSPGKDPRCAAPCRTSSSPSA